MGSTYSVYREVTMGNADHAHESQPRYTLLSRERGWQEGGPPNEGEALQ